MKNKPVEKDSLKSELNKSKYDLSSYQVDLILKAFRIHEAGIKKELEKETKKIKERFRCGACDEKISNLSHTHCCVALSVVSQIIKEVLE